MAELKFSSEQMEQFIDLYRSFECLWNIKCTDYRDINKRNNAYEAIADIMNISIENVKKKINNIRSTYLQEKKKVELQKVQGRAQRIFIFQAYFGLVVWPFWMTLQHQGKQCVLQLQNNM
ncbi:unnamed protein product [Acanthoscelides obtectus]|uniref:MADF domain-containing protein n=1 Tax=Acanthoscelides obtectus TaxID=200917 RepID=A0A9P0JWF6_ACAOB|nr:unnamed protein product [Acanthoscelides obtectus]CAK1625244.1 hypothetical protein AOBTE_LOCUS3054 [Acanthoscelides obtectus]